MTSIKDIAAKAKVSIGTVDRVLHNRGRVSEETKERIEQIVRRSGYRPNIYARNLSLDKNFRFGVLMPRLSQDSRYWEISSRGIEKAVRELERYKVRVRYHLYDRYSEQSFENALRQAVVRKPDGLLIAPVLPRVAEKTIPTIPQRIPFVFFDFMIPGTGCLSFIGQDPYQSGLLAAHLMHSVSRDKGSVAVVKVVPEDYHINERIRGFLSGMDESVHQGARIYEVDSHRGEGAFAATTAAILRENNRLSGIFVSNAWTHSIARYVHEREKKRSISILGYDLVAKNLRCLEEGRVDFLISQRPETQGYEGIYCLYEHVVLRETVKPRIMVPIDILTKENIKYYQG